MFTAFKARRPQPHDDPIINHRFWPVAVRRASQLSAGQSDAWLLATLGHAMRIAEQWRQSGHANDDLEELELAIVSQLAIVREFKRRARQEVL